MSYTTDFIFTPEMQGKLFQHIREFGERHNLDAVVMAAVLNKLSLVMMEELGMTNLEVIELDSQDVN